VPAVVVVVVVVMGTMMVDGDAEKNDQSERAFRNNGNASAKA